MCEATEERVAEGKVLSRALNTQKVQRWWLCSEIAYSVVLLVATRNIVDLLSVVEMGSSLMYLCVYEHAVTYIHNQPHVQKLSQFSVETCVVFGVQLAGRRREQAQ